MPGGLPEGLSSALTLWGRRSQSRQRGSTERVPSSRQAAPLGVRGGCGSAHPSSASERSAFVWLHRRAGGGGRWGGGAGGGGGRCVPGGGPRGGGGGRRGRCSPPPRRSRRRSGRPG